MTKPYTYPITIGANVTTGINNTPKILAAFKSKPSALKDIVANLVAMPFVPYSASDYGVLVLQIIGGCTVTNGTYTDIGTSNLQINKTCTTYTGGSIAVTQYILIGESNKGVPTAVAPTSASDLGLIMEEEQEFVIIGTVVTPGVTCDVYWSVNWTETSGDYQTTRIPIGTDWTFITYQGHVELLGQGVWTYSYLEPETPTGISYETGETLVVNGEGLWAKSSTALSSHAVVINPTE